MSKALIKFTNKWRNRQKYSGATTSKGMNSKFFQCTLHVNPRATRMHILAEVPEHVATARDRDVSRFFQTALNDSDQSIGFSLDQVHKMLGMSTSGTRPNIWTELDRKPMQVMEIHTESGHPVILGTTIFDHVTLRQKGGESNMHFNSMTQSLRMIEKLIELSNHWCMPYATVQKFPADLPEQTIDVARRNNSVSVKVVLT